MLGGFGLPLSLPQRLRGNHFSSFKDFRDSPGTRNLIHDALPHPVSGIDSCPGIPSTFPIRSRGSVWLSSQPRLNGAEIGSPPYAQHELAVHCGLAVSAAQCNFLERHWAYWQSQESSEALCFDIKGLSGEVMCDTSAYQSLSSATCRAGESSPNYQEPGKGRASKSRMPRPRALLAPLGFLPSPVTVGPGCGETQA